MKLLLLDMDGTVRRCKSDPTGFINSPHDQELIPEAKEAIARYHEAGWLIIGITNQGGVMAGYKTLEDAIAEQRRTMLLVPEIGSIFMCLDAGETCVAVHGTGREFWEQSDISFSAPASFRKSTDSPGHGMILAACELVSEQAETGIEAIAAALYVGDRPEDEATARYANVPFMWAKDWWFSSP